MDVFKNRSRSILFSMNRHLSIFDIIGPVMIGPSSSHTAGPLMIGRKIHETIKSGISSIKVKLYNSFADTGEGHGTRIALIAGLLGMDIEDENISDSLTIAANQGISIDFENVHSQSIYPNTADIVVNTVNGNYFARGTSLGGGIVDIKLVKMTW